MPDDRPGPSRPRPTYGLPGSGSPSSAAGSSRPLYGLPGEAPADGAPGDEYGRGPSLPTGSSAEPGYTPGGGWSNGDSGYAPGGGWSNGDSGYTPGGGWSNGNPGAAGTSAPSSAPAWGPPPSGVSPAPSSRRTGLVPLLLGIGALLLGGVVLVVGVIVGVGSMMGAVSDGPQALGGPSGTIDASGGQMYLILVPEAQADAAQCTANAADASAIDVAPGTGTLDFADGSGPYRQVLGVWVHDPTTVSITCEGADASYIGPISPSRLLISLGIGVIGGAVLGLLGLVLLIVGIVRLARSSRTA